MTTGPVSQCGTCQRLRSPFDRDRDTFGTGGPWCAAFPDTIPAEIFDNRVDHREPVDGDHGLQWLPRPGATYPRLFPRETMTAAIEPEPQVESPPTGMIALLPATHDADRLAVDDEGALPPSELHVTLAYFADVTHLNPDDLTNLCRQYVQALKPIQVEAFAVSLFNPLGEQPCVVLGLTGDQIADTHMDLTNLLHMTGLDLSGQHRPWIPHITLAYTDDHYAVADMVDRCGPITLDRLLCAIGDQVDVFPLGEGDNQSHDDAVGGGLPAG